MLSFPSSNRESWGHTAQIKITIDLPLYSSSCSSIHSHPGQVLPSAPEPSAIKSCLPICPIHDFLSSLTIIAPDQVPSIFFLTQSGIPASISSWFDLVVPLLSTLWCPPIPHSPKQWFLKYVWRNLSLMGLVEVLMSPVKKFCWVLNKLRDTGFQQMEMKIIMFITEKQYWRTWLSSGQVAWKHFPELNHRCPKP